MLERVTDTPGATPGTQARNMPSATMTGADRGDAIIAEIQEYCFAHTMGWSAEPDRSDTTPEPG